MFLGYGLEFRFAESYKLSSFELCFPPGGSKHPNTKAFDPKYYTVLAFGALYHDVWVLGPSGFAVSGRQSVARVMVQSLQKREPITPRMYIP